MTRNNDQKKRPEKTTRNNDEFKLQKSKEGKNQVIFDLDDEYEIMLTLEDL